MLVRHDVTRWIYYETASQTLQRLTDFSRSKPIVTEELCIKIVNRVANSALNNALGIDVNYCRQNLCHSQNGWFRSRISLCKTRRTSHKHQERRARADNTIFQRHMRSK